MIMLFRRHRQRNREAVTRLTRWALDQSGSATEIEQMYGPEHAEELGALAWLFRAVECEPHREPSLGLWQRFERELRERLTLLPPPTPRLALFLPPLLVLPALQSTEVKAAVGDLVMKAAAVAAVTTAVTFHIVSSGALEGLRVDGSSAGVPSVSPDFEPTGNAVIDRLRLTEAALSPGDVNLTRLGNSAHGSQTVSI